VAPRYPRGGQQAAVVLHLVYLVAVLHRNVIKPVAVLPPGGKADAQGARDEPGYHGVGPGPGGAVEPEVEGAAPAYGPDRFHRAAHAHLDHLVDAVDHAADGFTIRAGSKHHQSGRRELCPDVQDRRGQDNGVSDGGVPQDADRPDRGKSLLPLPVHDTQEGDHRDAQIAVDKAKDNIGSPIKMNQSVEQLMHGGAALE